jgi:uncharacterized repeat protein (TIGR03803 family)
MKRIIEVFRSNAGPYKELLRANFVASAVALLGLLASQPAQAQTLTVLYSFGACCADGFLPSAGVIRDSGGNLYGTTADGGPSKWGTVFKISAHHEETILYSFTGGVDGASPYGGLVRDAAGNLYGTTTLGGAHGYGTVFKVDATGKESVLYSFMGGTDGGGPYGSLAMDASGNFYGTTSGGGTSAAGTVFKLSRRGKENVLYTFTGGTGGTDGASPLAGVTLDPAGNLYGTTSAGGGPNNYGTVFKIDTGGNETVLHAFAGGADGQDPEGGLVRDFAGNLYGTTNVGGGDGNVFKIDAAGNYSVLFNFNQTDGQYPSGGLLRDSAGNLYGTTIFGGEYNWGTVFKLDTMGNETVLYSFTGGKDGKYPTGVTLIRDASGNLFGTTQQGGSMSNGVVFKLKP